MSSAHGPVLTQCSLAASTALQRSDLAHPLTAMLALALSLRLLPQRHRSPSVPSSGSPSAK